jgi:hypothetical protein
MVGTWPSGSSHGRKRKRRQPNPSHHPAPSSVLLPPHYLSLHELVPNLVRLQIQGSDAHSSVPCTLTAVVRKDVGVHLHIPLFPPPPVLAEEVPMIPRKKHLNGVALKKTVG